MQPRAVAVAGHQETTTPPDDEHDLLDDAAPTRKAPLWAKLSVIFGAVLMLLSGGVVVAEKALVAYANQGLKQEQLLPTDPQGKNIDGPINILLLGMDQRAHSADLIRTDSIIILHVNAAHDRAYMVSIPRDTRVDIPAFPESNYPGGTDKINAAFAFGNRLPGDKPDPSTAGRRRGVQLTVQTIQHLVPGGLTFNAVAIINYDGFRKVVEALGGVKMCIDETVVSEQYDMNGKYHSSTRHDGVQGFTYKPGCRTLPPWQALDYVRQRKGLPHGDYDRQRHQQQFLSAVFREMLSKGTLTNPAKINKLIGAAGDLLTIDLNQIPLLDWIFTLKAINGSSITMVKTNGGQYASLDIGGQSFQTLTPDSMKLLQAVHDDDVGQFVVQHPTWIAKSS